MNSQILNIAFEESIDTQAINHMRNSFSAFGDDAEFHEQPDKGIQASIFLLTMSSIAIIFGGAFVKKLGDKAAEDAYGVIKSGLASVYQKYFGANPEYKMIITASAKEKAPKTKYSLILSLYCIGKQGERVKLLYDTNWTKEQFDKVTDLYLAAISEFVSKDTGDIQTILNTTPCIMQPNLIAWDETTNDLVFINPIPESVRI